MLSNDPSYRRLRTGGYGASGSASYWLGRDHLFVVAMNGYVERYHRFMFADVQAVVIRRNRLQLVWGLLFGGLLMVSSLGALASLGGRSPANLDTGTLTGVIILAGLALGFLTLLLTNWLMGPTCVCHLCTAVQTLQLPQIRRWPRAQVLVDELSPLVMATQAGLAQTDSKSIPIRIDLPPEPEAQPLPDTPVEPEAPPPAEL